MIRSSSISDFPPQHLLYHLIPLGRRMPGHPGTSGDGWQLVTSGWNFMYVPNCKPPHKSLATAREQLYDFR